MTGLESVLDGRKHYPNEAGLGAGMQILRHGAQCGFCLFDHRSGANKNQPKPTRANTSQQRDTCFYHDFTPKATFVNIKTTKANTSTVQQRRFCATETAYLHQTARIGT